MSYYSGLYRTLKAATDERGVHKYLKNKPSILFYAFDHLYKFHVCISEFEFANDYRADFAILGGHSGGCVANFLELESPLARLYLKDGTQSKTLRIAFRQIRDWQEWIRLNPDGLRKCLKKSIKSSIESSKLLKSKDTNIALDRLANSDCVIEPHYQIIIGRRSRLTADEQHRRSIEAIHDGGIQIATYDRYLEISKLTDIREKSIGNPWRE